MQNNTLNKANNTRSDYINIYRYRYEELEKHVMREHEKIKPTAVELGQDLASMNKPEPEAEKDIYTGEIQSAYRKLSSYATKELQSGIEQIHIDSENKNADFRLKGLTKECQKKETTLRLKERELSKCDHSLLKKEERYTFTRYFNLFLVVVDLTLSANALMSMGYPLWVASIVGLALGIGIFFLAENLPDIIDKGKSTLSRWLIGLTVFSFLFSIFYVLGMFRSTLIKASSDSLTYGTNPLYFAILNLFFTIIACMVVYFRGLRQEEKRQLDCLKTLREEVKNLNKEIGTLKERIITTRENASTTEISRKYLILYADNLRDLIQRCFEESLQKFYSTNCIYRSDGKTPAFFAQPSPQLPSLTQT